MNCTSSGLKANVPTGVLPARAEQQDGRARAGAVVRGSYRLHVHGHPARAHRRHRQGHR